MLFLITDANYIGKNHKTNSKSGFFEENKLT